MRFTFLKRKARDYPCYEDGYHNKEYSFEQTGNNKKNKKVFARVALYGGVFVVFVVAAGGYYYLNFTRISLDERVPNGPPVFVKAIDLGKEQNDPPSLGVELAQGPPGKAGQLRIPPTSNVPAMPPPFTLNSKDAVLSVGTESEEKTGSLEILPSKTNSTSARNKGGNNVDKSPMVVSSNEADTLLDQLVLRDDNPFRDKFLRRFLDSHASVTPQKSNGGSVDERRPYRSSTTERKVRGFTEEGLDILPVTIGEKRDAPGGFKVFGVIRTQKDSIALTNKGELKIGSIVDDDTIVRIDINEVSFKSGKTFKVSAQ